MTKTKTVQKVQNVKHCFSCSLKQYNSRLKTETHYATNRCDIACVQTSPISFDFRRLHAGYCDTSRRQVAPSLRQVASCALLMRQVAATSRCDKTLVRCTQANLEEEKCKLVSKFNMADQRIQRGSNKKKLLVLLIPSLSNHDNDQGDDDRK